MWFCASVLNVAERDGERKTDSIWEEQLFLIESDASFATLSRRV